jgi:tripartite-type tricarboxylate transporter receptor subunit TctC
MNKFRLSIPLIAMTRSIAMLATAATALLTLHASPALADNYPSKPITLIVPASPGGTSDFSGRVIGEMLSKELGQPVLVDNRPGAGNTIGAALVAKAAPDGYTLLLIDTTLTISPSLAAHLPYDTGTAFTHIGLVATAPYALIVKAGSPYKSVKELVAYGRAHPGKLTYASGGTGTGPHLAGALLGSSAGLNMVHVPYKGAAPALTDLLGGQVDLMFAGIPTALAQAKAGTVLPLAITDAGGRSPALPSVPTVAEAGFPNYSVLAWFGVSGPKGMNPAVVAKLNAAINKIVEMPDVKQKLLLQGAISAPTSPQAFDKLFHADMARWAKVVADNHIPRAD